MVRTHGIDKPKPDKTERQRQWLQEELTSVERLLVVWNSKAMGIRAALTQLANPLANSSQDSQGIANACPEGAQSQVSAEVAAKREQKTEPSTPQPVPSKKQRGRPGKQSSKLGLLSPIEKLPSDLPTLVS